MALSCDLRICGNSYLGLILPKLIWLLGSSHSFSSSIFSEVDGFPIHDLGEDAVLSMPETGLAIIPGYV